MRDVELYQQLLGLIAPWAVGRVEPLVEGDLRCYVSGRTPRHAAAACSRTPRACTNFSIVS